MYIEILEENITRMYVMPQTMKVLFLTVSSQNTVFDNCLISLEQFYLHVVY